MLSHTIEGLMIVILHYNTLFTMFCAMQETD